MIMAVLATLVNAIDRIVHDFDGFATLNTWRLFLTPIVLTLALLPFIYGMALWLSYGSLFFQLNWQVADRKIANYAKRRVFRACRFRLRAIRRFGADYPEDLLRANTTAEVDRAVERIRANRSEDS
jgi:hypothetical protein